jgi:hypothetical protein
VDRNSATTAGLLLLTIATSLACAHAPPESRVENENAIYAAAARYAIFHLGDPSIREGQPETWRDRDFCIEVDEKPAPEALLRVLRSDGLGVSGTWTGKSFKLVRMGELEMNGERATLHVGVVWGEGGILDLRWGGRDWEPVALRRRWVSTR